jgi:predicted membrane-bound spermidine synthase
LFPPDRVGRDAVGVMVRVFLPVVLFLASAGGLVVEIVAGRLIAPYVGMSLYTWTAIIAVVLAGLSIGHWIGGRMAGPSVDRSTGLGRLAAALAFAGVTTVLALVALNALALGLLSSGLGQVTIVVLLTTALFLLPSLFVGIVAPIVTKLAVDAEPDQTGAVLGRMYAIGTVGSIVGTMSAGYFFISWVGSSGTLIAVALLYLILAGLCAGFADRRAVTTVAILVIAGVVPLGVIGAARGAFTSRCTVESDYFCILIDDFAQVSGRPSSLMVLDNLVHSINDRDDPSLLYSPYIHFVDEYTRRRFPLDGPNREFAAFFVGGGGYTLPRSWAATVDGADLVVAEIDPAVTRVAAERLWFNAADPAIEIHHRDARAVLQEMPRGPRFNVVFGDAFHDISVPTHLVSREFHHVVADRLTADGFYVVNVVDAARDPRLVAALARTLRIDFSAIEIWLEDGDAPDTTGHPTGRVTYILVASAAPAPVDTLHAAFGIRRSWRRLPADALDLDHAIVLTDDFAPVDRLLSAVLFSEVAKP